MPANVSSLTWLSFHNLAEKCAANSFADFKFWEKLYESLVSCCSTSPNYSHVLVVTCCVKLKQ